MLQEWLASFSSDAFIQNFEIAVREASKLFLAAFLGVLLSFRRQPDRYRLNLIEAHAFLAMAGAMFMLVISGEIIRAVALLGAASVVRYRYAITNPRDASTLILSLGVGMGCGSDLLIQVTAATFLILIVGRLLAVFPEALPFSIVNRREEMILRVQTDDYPKTMERLEAIFEGRGITYSLVSYEMKYRKIGEEPVTEVDLHVNMGSETSLHDLTNEMVGQGIYRISWHNP